MASSWSEQAGPAVKQDVASLLNAAFDVTVGTFDGGMASRQFTIPHGPRRGAERTHGLRRRLDRLSGRVGDRGRAHAAGGARRARLRRRAEPDAPWLRGPPGGPRFRRHDRAGGRDQARRCSTSSARRSPTRTGGCSSDRRPLPTLRGCPGGAGGPPRMAGARRRTAGGRALLGPAMPRLRLEQPGRDRADRPDRSRRARRPTAHRGAGPVRHGGSRRDRSPRPRRAQRGARVARSGPGRP